MKKLSYMLCLIAASALCAENAGAQGRCAKCASKLELSPQEALCLTLRLPRVLQNRGDPLMVRISGCMVGGSDLERSVERLPSIQRGTPGFVWLRRTDVICLQNRLASRARNEHIGIDFARC